MSDKAFFDTNVLLYLLSADVAKADRAETLLLQGGVISVQVLNEFTAVAIGKLRMPWSEVNETLDTVRGICRVEPVSTETYDQGRELIARYSLSVYDAMIVASAILAGCEVLYSEDMHDGLRVLDRLTIDNPFK
jgi:predicted nucleic acid-binding protein